MCRSTLHLWTSKCLTEVVILISKMRKQRCWERKWLSRSVAKQGKNPLSLYCRHRWGNRGEQTCPHLIRTAGSQMQWRHSDTAGRAPNHATSHRASKAWFLPVSSSFVSSPVLQRCLLLAFDVTIGSTWGSTYLSLTKGTRGVWLLSFLVCFPKTLGNFRIFEPSCCLWSLRQ